MTSAYALNKIKKLLGKKVKCGHMGTLDPMASGVLPVGIGKATRLFNYLLDKDKVYEAEFTFGYETDTLDAEGVTILEGGRIPTLEEVQTASQSLVGIINRIPPSYSAKNVAGTRSYVLARKGIAVELPPKEVEIFYIKLIGGESPAYRFEICCGGGTYIRSICRDIAYALGTFATMTALERTASGFFTVENCIHLDDFLAHENPRSLLIPSDEPLRYEKLVLDKTQGTRLLNGLRDPYDLPNGKYCVYCEGEFWGVGIIEEQKLVVKPYVRG
jgi:tRNA pseudouridine55 synthase